jgi:hypothetical protein
MTSIEPTDRPVSRREFLRVGGLAAAAIVALVAGCRPSGTAETTSDASGQTDVLTTVATATAVVQSPTAIATTAPTSTPAAQQSLGVACPFGLVNDPYPGRCKRYSDSDGNGYCDFSVLGSGNMTPHSG